MTTWKGRKKPRSGSDFINTKTQRHEGTKFSLCLRAFVSLCFRPSLTTYRRNFDSAAGTRVGPQSRPPHHVSIVFPDLHVPLRTLPRFVESPRAQVCPHLLRTCVAHRRIAIELKSSVPAVL